MAFFAAQVAGMALTPYLNELSDIVNSHQDIKKTIKGIGYQAICGLIGTVIGGLVLGPPGALVGGVFGAIYGYRNVRNYKSAVGLMMSMPEEEKQLLIIQVQQMVGADSVEALRKFAGNLGNRQQVADLVFSWVAGTKMS